MRYTYKHPLLSAPYGGLQKLISWDLRIADSLMKIFGRAYDAAKVYIYARCYGSNKRKALKNSLRALFHGVRK